MSRVYLEGGGDSKELNARCREGFRKLLEKSGFKLRMPRLVASGGRADTFNDFLIAYHGAETYVAMIVDSEDPVADIEATWDHLRARDGWLRPPGAENEQVVLMTTCMETWIAADREALQEHYGAGLQVTALPPLVNLEQRSRHDIQNQLVNATRATAKKYTKGAQSFEILGKLDPTTLVTHLPSFVRMRRVLNARL
jgi:hypothetical protein